jgi:hypothetical protein
MKQSEEKIPTDDLVARSFRVELASSVHSSFFAVTRCDRGSFMTVDTRTTRLDDATKHEVAHIHRSCFHDTTREKRRVVVVAATTTVPATTTTAPAVFG